MPLLLLLLLLLLVLLLSTVKYTCLNELNDFLWNKKVKHYRLNEMIIFETNFAIMSWNKIWSYPEKNQIFSFFYAFIYNIN